MGNFFDDIELDDTTEDIVSVKPKESNTVSQIDAMLSNDNETATNSEETTNDAENDILIENSENNNVDEANLDMDDDMMVEPEPTIKQEPEPIETPKKEEKPRVSSDKTTVIEGVITGNIKHVGNITVNGTIDGSLDNQNGLVIVNETGVITKNITGDSDITIKGTVNGKISGKDINIEGSKIKGDIVTTGAVVITNKAKVIGNISCDSALIDAAIKGNLTVKGELTLHKNAIVQGQVKTNTMKIESGVALDGSCTLTNSNVDFDKIFAED